MSNLSQRLTELRNEHKLTQKELAIMFNMSPTGYAGWEQGRCEPSIEWILKLCDFFDVTADFLLGRTDDY